jgi:Barstar (barnase inhibitor)
MTTMNSIVSGQAMTQIYRLSSDIAPEEFAANLQMESGELFYLDGAEMTDKEQLMQEFAAVLNFPDYFGGNWDALQDCLSDFDWREEGATHCVLLFDRWEKCTSPNLLETLQSAVAGWNTAADAVYVLLRTSNPDEYVQKLPTVR